MSPLYLRFFSALLFALITVKARATYAQLDSSTISEPALEKLLHSSSQTDSDALIILKDGNVVTENYFSRGKRPLSIQSVTKSFSSLLVGFLLADRKLNSLDESIARWYPTVADHPWKSKITVRMLLNHTSGITDKEAAWASQDFVKFYLNQPLKFEPGTSYEYTTGGTALLAPIIASTAGSDVRDLIREKLFQPLDIHEWEWVNVPGGSVATGGGLTMQAMDLAKVGQLLLQKGRWKGQQIVSEKWLAESLTPSQPYFQDYGLLWWKLDNEIFYAQGWGGQYMVVDPASGIVAVRLRTTLDKQSPDGFKKNSFYDFPQRIKNLTRPAPTAL